MNGISLDPITFYFKKPQQWKYMSMWEKIKVYKNILDKSYAPFVDKLTAKGIVKHICGDRIEVAKVVRILSSPDDLTEADFQEHRMVMASHGSGWNIILHPSLSLNDVKMKLHKWNTHYIGNQSGESQYQYIEPRFFIEEVIDDIDLGKTGEAQVFMIRCIHGRPIIISVRRGDYQNSYDLNWNPIQLQKKFTIKRPKCLLRMLTIAEQLSAPFEFVRIDFYVSRNDTIFFSEYTFTPAGGNRVFSNDLEKKFGALWQ